MSFSADHSARLFSAVLIVLMVSTAQALDVGVCVHLNRGPELDAINQMGMKWVRIDVRWDIIESQKDVWTFQAYDEALGMYKKRGFQVFGTLQATPAWASSNGKDNGLPDPIAWGNFVKRTVERYKDRIKVWGVWNEPNLGGFWVGTADQYVNLLLNPAHAAIKAIDPSLKVAGPELAFLRRATISPQKFYETIKKAGAADKIDIVTQHAYGDPFEERLEGKKILFVRIHKGIEQVLKKTGFWGKPFWLTEFGWDVAIDGEAKQAGRIKGALDYLKSEGWVEKAFIYELIDDPNITQKWGLLSFPPAARPVVNMLKDWISSH